MFANQSISNNIGIVYLKENKCSLIFGAKNQEKRQKTTEKEATGQSFRLRTPTPKPDTDTDSESVQLVA